MSDSIIKGAIIGDICGSIYESKDELTPIFNFDEVVENGRFTDDTVLTIANLDALQNVNLDSVKSLEFYAYFMKWGKKYPHCGFSRHFSELIKANDPNPKAIFSSTNGAIMRASPFLILPDLNMINDLLHKQIAITHNGYDAHIAVNKYFSIYKALEKGDNILHVLCEDTFFRDWMHLETYSYDEVYRDLKKFHGFDMTALGTLRDALAVLLVSTDFEQVVKNSIELGGDTDTIAAVACSLAPVMGMQIPKKYLDLIPAKLTGEMVDVLEA